MADGVVVGTREISQRALSKYVEWIYDGVEEAGRSREEVEISPRVPYVFLTNLKRHGRV